MKIILTKSIPLSNTSGLVFQATSFAKQNGGVKYFKASAIKKDKLKCVALPDFEYCFDDISASEKVHWNKHGLDEKFVELVNINPGGDEAIFDTWRSLGCWVKSKERYGYLVLNQDVADISSDSLDQSADLNLDRHWYVGYACEESKIETQQPEK